MDKPDKDEFVNVVLGNQSADLDSIASSIALAHLLTSQANHKTKYIPAININRKELDLRYDVTFVLKTAFSFDILKSLVFIDEINLSKLKNEGLLKLWLVDHHELAPSQIDLIQSVCLVVDHHKREETIISKLSQNAEIVIEPVGSCCTLIAERYFQSSCELSPDYALLLYAAIVIDTSHFTVALNKATRKDIEIGKRLEKIIRNQWTDFDSQSFYNEISKCRKDTSKLSFEQLLLKDYKYFSIDDTLNVGFSTVRCCLEALISKSEDAAKDFKRFCTSKDIEILIILSNVGKSELYLAVYCRNLDHLPLVEQILTKDQKFVDLKLKPYGLCSDDPIKGDAADFTFFSSAEGRKHFLAYIRGNGLWTRKQVMPFLKEALQERHIQRRKESKSGKKFIQGKVSAIMESTTHSSVNCPSEDHLQQLAAQAIEKSCADLQREYSSPPNVDRRNVASKVIKSSGDNDDDDSSLVANDVTTSSSATVVDDWSERISQPPIAGEFDSLSAEATHPRSDLIDEDEHTTLKTSSPVASGRQIVFDNRCFDLTDQCQSTSETPSSTFTAGTATTNSKDSSHAPLDRLAEKTSKDLDDFVKALNQNRKVSNQSELENFYTHVENANGDGSGGGARRPLAVVVEKNTHPSNECGTRDAVKREASGEIFAQQISSDEINRSISDGNYMNNNNTTVPAVTTSYPPTPPNSFLNTPRVPPDTAITFEPEKVDQKLRKISQETSSCPPSGHSSSGIEEPELRRANLGTAMAVDTKNQYNNIYDAQNIKIRGEQKSSAPDNVLYLDFGASKLNENQRQGFTAMSDSESDWGQGNSTGRSQAVSVQLDWLDDDYKACEDPSNTSRVSQRGSLSEDENVGDKSARTDGGEKDQEDLEWENDTPVNNYPNASNATLTSIITDEAVKRRNVKVSGCNYEIDMNLIETYRNVMSHGGYFTDGLTAVVVFSACRLPHRKDPNYHTLMENLFFYAVSSLETVIAEDYVIVYFQGGASNDQLPSFSWLRKCYRLMDQRHVNYTEPGLDRKMRKNLKQLILVHSTFWLKTIITVSKPFISSKFYKKIRFVNSLQELSSIVPLQHIEIPEQVLKHEDRKHDLSLAPETQTD